MKTPSRPSQQKGNAIIGIIVILGIIWAVTALFSNDEPQPYQNYAPATVYDSYDSNTYGSYDSYEDEEYAAGFSGTETMEACNNDTGRCYDLDIDSDGKPETADEASKTLDESQLVDLSFLRRLKTSGFLDKFRR